MAFISPTRTDGKYCARYRDSSGREHSRHFTRKVNVQRWFDEVTVAVVTGAYVDPKAGKVTFREYAEAWRAKQLHRPGTVEQVERSLRKHVYPRIGDKPIATVLLSDLQALVKAMSLDLSPASVGVVYRITAAVFMRQVRCSASRSTASTS